MSLIKKFIFLTFTFFLLLITLPQPTYAHAFGALYNLPIPLWLYLFAGAATLLVSFILIGLIIRESAGIIKFPKFKLLQLHPNPIVIQVLKFLSVFLFLLTILTGIFGVDNSLQNFNMTFFWVIFSLGFYYLSIFGNFYDATNPLKILFGSESKLVEYPKKMSYLPALLFFVILIWIELFLGVGPLKLSLILIIYTVINLLGTRIFGSKDWFEYCELFGVLFRTVSRKINTESPTIVIFILFMLSSTAFDGLHTTVPWYKFLVILNGNIDFLQTISLVLSPFIFLLIYSSLIFLMRVITKSKMQFKELLVKFSLSLIPIAIVYNIAHYYTLLINQGQEIIRLVSDPFGFGWNLFGTANFKNILFTDAGFIWHSQVALILTGHIIGVYLAHKTALEIFKSRKITLISQIPMLILMIIFTLFGLWILSQPITVSAQ